MNISNEMMNLLSFLSGRMILLYIALFVIVMYLIISLLTWSFLKPLKYLGIPTLCVGILFIFARFFSTIMIDLLNIKINIIKTLLPSMLSPVLINGILCTVLGLIMIIVYAVINKRIKSKEIVA